MVKPIFPSRRCETTRSPGFTYGATSYSETDARNGELYMPREDDARGTEYLPSSSSLLSDDSVFSSGGSYVHPFGNSGYQTHSFQSYDGSLPFTLPTPAPRERISSLPDGEEARPVPRERRRSAPVGMDFAESDSHTGPPASSTTEELPPALRDIATKGQELFWFILSEEVKAQEAAAPGRLSALTIFPSCQRMEVLNERARFGGRTLSQIAEAFSHSAQRMRVREHAERVDLQSLNYTSFSDLLFGLFQEGGVTQARVLVLFFFCADVALRALRENLFHHFKQLVDWTSRYITERLSAWVLDHGGWAAVLQESVDQAYKMAVIGVSVLGIFAMAAFIWRNH